MNFTSNFLTFARFLKQLFEPVSPIKKSISKSDNIIATLLTKWRIANKDFHFPGFPDPQNDFQTFSFAIFMNDKNRKKITKFLANLAVKWRSKISHNNKNKSQTDQNQDKRKWFITITLWLDLNSKSCFWEEKSVLSIWEHICHKTKHIPFFIAKSWDCPKMSKHLRTILRMTKDHFNCRAQ